MSIQERIRMCQLIEQMEKRKELSKRLGLENESKFHGKSINECNKRNDEQFITEEEIQYG